MLSASCAPGGDAPLDIAVDQDETLVGAVRLAIHVADYLSYTRPRALRQ